MERPFLTAAWRHLAMVNYEVDPAILLPHLPAGTELDLWQGRALASVVGFLFLDTRLRGVPVPFHRDFEEVNLRFYVRRRAEDEWRRAVVFVKELVPRRAIAWAARRFYNENYIALPMGHAVDDDKDVQRIAYSWQRGKARESVELETAGPLRPIAENSPEEFITEHYWGYSRQRDGGTLEYRVEHPRWQYRTARATRLACDVEALYGASFAPFLEAAPVSSFVADGSAIAVFPGRRIAIP